jgi:hypothetical protein
MIEAKSLFRQTLARPVPRHALTEGVRAEIRLLPVEPELPSLGVRVELTTPFVRPETPVALATRLRVRALVLAPLSMERSQAPPM